MSNIADEHLKALSGQASTQITPPWAAGTQTQREVEFDQKLAWDKEKHAKELAAATRGASPYGPGAEGFANMRGTLGMDMSHLPPEIAALDPDRQETYEVVMEAIADGDSFDSIVRTLNRARGLGKIDDKQLKELLMFAEMIYEEEIQKATSRNITRTPHEPLIPYFNRLGQAGMEHSTAKRQGMDLDAFRKEEGKNTHGDGFLVPPSEHAAGAGANAITRPTGIEALVERIMGK